MPEQLPTQLLTGTFRDASLQVTERGGLRQIGWGEPEAPLILIDGVDYTDGAAPPPHNLRRVVSATPWRSVVDPT